MRWKTPAVFFRDSAACLFILLPTSHVCVSAQNGVFTYMFENYAVTTKNTVYVIPDGVTDRMDRFRGTSPEDITPVNVKRNFSELRSGQPLQAKMYPRMAETSVTVDHCAENQMCSSKKYPTDSMTSLHSCNCGPNCGPDKCNGRQSTSLVSWDAARTKIFLLLIATFAAWLLIYAIISVKTISQPED